MEPHAGMVTTKCDAYRDMKSVRGDGTMFCANMHKTIALREEWIAKYGVRALIDAYETAMKNGRHQ